MSANLSQRTEDGLKCARCDAELGVDDVRAEGLRLFKWSVSLQRAQNSAWETHPVQSFVCAQLLALLDAQAIRKFVAYSGTLEDTTGAILVRVSRIRSICTAPWPYADTV